AAAAATLWVEKEQLYGVGMALKKMNETERPKKEGGAGAGEEAETGILDDTEILAGNAGENLEFKVSRLALAFGPGEEYITLFFNDERDEEEVTERAEEEPEEEEYGDEEEKEEGPPPKLQVSLARLQSEEFVRESLEACSSGRGVDALSRNALVATGKVDPNRNGHFHH
ncbi:MAG: DUF3090 family protein, partial [Nitrospinota bacterium]|nr:DUF3090 family protein [Nitrospinota bacterium]